MEPSDLKPYKWLHEVSIYNKNGEIVPIQWLEEKADVIVLLFTANNVDKNGVVEKFYKIYEDIKFVNIPIEVIFVPMDDLEEDSIKAYEDQANWFKIKFHDPMVSILKYMYNITCIPHLLVIKIDGTIVSNHGIRDLEEYGKNAIITWTSRNASTTKHRQLSKELEMYGKKWKYMNSDSRKDKADYKRRFSKDMDADE